MMASDGANPQRLVEKMGLNGLFTWMPDGRGIVHVGAERQLYLLDLATKTERKLTYEPGIMPVVTISPDGRWVIYQCLSCAGPVPELAIGTPEKITDFVVTPISFIENTQLSRDGKQLAYSRGNITSDIWLITLHSP